MKELLLYLAKSIVEKTDSVKVEETIDSNGFVNLHLSVDSSDMGKIIGKNGKVIKAIRNLVRIVAIKEGKRVNIELLEEGASPIQTPKEEETQKEQ